MRFKPLVRNINVLNVLLMAGIAAFALSILPPLFGTKVTLTMPSPKKSGEEKEEKTVEAKSPSPLEYTLIAEQNLFHTERKIPEKVDTAAFTKPEFVLYGTMIIDGMSMAYMEDLKAPSSTPGRGKRQRALQAGSQLSGYTLSEVYHDKVVMARGTDKIEVRVLDNKQRETTAGAGSSPKPIEGQKPQQPKSPPSTPSRSLTTAKERPAPATQSTPSKFRPTMKETPAPVPPGQ